MQNYFNYTKYKDNIAVIDAVGGHYTYADILEKVQLVDQELDSGLAFCFCRNTIGSLLGYLSFLESGVPAVMIDATKDLDSISKLLAIYNPNYLWLPNELLTDYKGEVLCTIFDYSLVLYNSTKVEIHKDLALLLPTSGSTGSPKLVRLTQKNILSNAKSIAKYLNITSDERPITSLPMHYSYGISVLNSHLLKGATILLTDYSVMQKEFWTFTKEKEATSISGVPYTYEMLRRLRIFNMDLPRLKTLTQAGGKLNPKLVKEYVEQARRHNKQFIVMYGQTEATARMSYLPFEYALDKHSSIGIAIPDGEFKIIDANGKDIDEFNVDGELVYRGENVSMGYAQSLEDLTEGDENKGILKTGDIARRDKDGFYYITGRLKRFVKVFGNRVNLDAIEQILKHIPNTQSACVGVDDKITVFVTEESKINDIRSLLITKTGLNRQAFNVKFIDNIPTNSSGKIQYADLMNLL